MPVTTSPVMTPIRPSRPSREASRISTRGRHGPQRVVLVHDRDAEDGHHGVADELLDAAAVALDDRLHPLEVAWRGASRRRSGSSASPSAVDPARSQNSTVTVFRCSTLRTAVTGAR